MLMHEDATVTNCHVLTPNVPRYTFGCPSIPPVRSLISTSILRTADIVIAAIGVPRAIRGSWIKPGAAVIDVGINITPEGKIVGDIHFDEVLYSSASLSHFFDFVRCHTGAQSSRFSHSCPWRRGTYDGCNANGKHVEQL